MIWVNFMAFNYTSKKIMQFILFKNNKMDRKGQYKNKKYIYN